MAFLLRPKENTGMEQRALPFFRYHPNPEQTRPIVREEIICEACDCITEIEEPCPWCIKNETAARKFAAEFQQDVDESVDNEEAIEELLRRTPGCLNWQGEYRPRPLQ